MTKLTKDMLKKIAPYAKDHILTALVDPLNEHLPKYGLDNKTRVKHFLAQAAHETAGFKTLEEYASGVAYEGRKDLGNTQKGDGKRYKGRGIFQLTGRANYKTFGKKLGKDLENNPVLAGDAETSVLIALEYWNNRKLTPLADKEDVTAITKKINGGLNGFEDRKKYLAKAEKVLPDDLFKVEVEVELPPVVETVVTEIVVDLPEKKEEIVVETTQKTEEVVVQPPSVVTLLLELLKKIFSKQG